MAARNLVLCLLGFTMYVLSAGNAQAGLPDPSIWQVNGVERQALVFTPSAKSPDGKSPVVLVFHGHGGNMRLAARAWRFQELWPQAIVVYMQGLPTPTPIDPQGTKNGWQREPGDMGDRDLKFVDAVLDSLRKDHGVDDTRIYATGFSNGAFFSYLLWGERARTFAAFAICAGKISATAPPTEPRPLLQIAGERDPLVAYDDQMQSVAAIRKLDQVNGNGESCGTGCTLYPSRIGVPVEVFSHPGGHSCPQEAADLTVKFFKDNILRR